MSQAFFEVLPFVSLSDRHNQDHIRRIKCTLPPFEQLPDQRLTIGNSQLDEPSVCVSPNRTVPPANEVSTRSLFSFSDARDSRRVPFFPL